MTTYKEAGVDVETKERVIEDIKKSVRATFTQDVLGAATTFKFGGTISLKRIMESYNEPVLVLSTDGVGTKMEIAERMKKYDTVGVDILNHSMNDVLTSGAQALFFLDYIGTSKLDVHIIKEMVEGIAKECRKKGIILAGGETAEMPGVYHTGKYELTGTVGGIVERELLIDGTAVSKGDMLIALPSSGLHTNGYTLARKVFFEQHSYSCSDKLPGLKVTLGEALLATHKEYATAVLPLIRKKLVRGIVHITGGGFLGNIPRIMPPGLGAHIRLGSWTVPRIFTLIEELGNVPHDDMLRTFNMGVGMVLAVAPKDKEAVLAHLVSEQAFVIGEVIAQEGVHYSP